MASGIFSDWVALVKEEYVPKAFMLSYSHIETHKKKHHSKTLLGFYVPRTSAASLREKQSGWNNVAGVHVIWYSIDTYWHKYACIVQIPCNEKFFLTLPWLAKKTKRKRRLSTTALFTIALSPIGAIPLTHCSLHQRCCYITILLHSHTNTINIMIWNQMQIYTNIVTLSS